MGMPRVVARRKIQIYDTNRRYTFASNIRSWVLNASSANCCQSVRTATSNPEGQSVTNRWPDYQYLHHVQIAPCKLLRVRHGPPPTKESTCQHSSHSLKRRACTKCHRCHCDRLGLPNAAASLRKRPLRRSQSHH